MTFFVVLCVHLSLLHSVFTASYEEIDRRYKFDSRFEDSGEQIVLKDRENWHEANSTYEFGVEMIDGTQVHIEKFFRYHPLVIINVPSNFQSVINELNEISDWDVKHKYTYHVRVLVFPGDQFSKEQNWTNKQIKKFSWNNEYKFFLFKKIDVTGPNAHPLYLYLQSLDIGLDGEKGEITSDFIKFIVNRRGVPVVRLNSSTTVKDIQRTMEERNLWTDYTKRYFPEPHNVNPHDYKFDSLLFYE